MNDLPVTHEQLAQSLEAVRRYVASMSAMVLRVSQKDFSEYYDKFDREDEEFLKLIAALRDQS